MNTIAQTSDDLTTPTSVTGLPRFLSYMRYPAFSREWFMARTRLFGACGLLYSLTSSLRLMPAYKNWGAAALSALMMWLAFMGAITVGPWLAMRARSQQRVLAKEWRKVVIAIVTGLLVGGFVEVGGWVLVRSFVRDSMGLPFKTSSVTSEFMGLALVLSLLTFLLKYSFYSGGFALRSYFSERRRAEQAKQQHELAQLKIQKHEADQQLAILQAQIEPHFLFNTLASVRSLVTQDQGRAAAMIDGLANYLRVTLPKLRTADSTSTLGEQLDICTSYLELMRLRMGERFSFTVDVPKSLRDATVPALLLLPLVENAVTHGVEPKPGFSTIHISARLEHLASPALRIEIKDDGVGLRANQPGKDVGKGMGLANIRSQLNLRYGTNASLEVSSPAGGGTCSVLVIPSHVT